MRAVEVSPQKGQTVKDSLGDRMKQYEGRESLRRFLPMTPLVVRVDGRGFSKFTKGMQRPFDSQMAQAMDAMAQYLVEQTHARVAYTQSDECTLILKPRDMEDANVFAGRIMKMTSTIAGLATAKFLEHALHYWPERCAKSLPTFDARIFEVPSSEEAVNAVLWREWDATKNAISMSAHHHFDHASLQGLSGAQMQERLFQEKGINFNDYPVRFKRGVYFQRKSVMRALAPEQLARIPQHHRPTGPILRREVVCLELPPLSKVINRVDVLMDGAEPQVA